MDDHGSMLEYLRGLAPPERYHLRHLLDCETCRGEAIQAIDRSDAEQQLDLRMRAPAPRLAAMPRRRRGRPDHIPHLVHLVDRAPAAAVRRRCAE